jgi:hypothetical protein
VWSQGAGSASGGRQAGNGGRHCKICCCDFCADSSALGVKNWEMFARVVNRMQFCMSFSYDVRILFHGTAQQKAVDFFVQA